MGHATRTFVGLLVIVVLLSVCKYLDRHERPCIDACVQKCHQK